jgi:hypothetical protein
VHPVARTTSELVQKANTCGEVHRDLICRRVSEVASTERELGFYTQDRRKSFTFTRTGKQTYHGGLAVKTPFVNAIKDSMKRRKTMKNRFA